MAGALRPFTRPGLRRAIVEINESLYQIIDEAAIDVLLDFGHSEAAVESARSKLDDFAAGASRRGAASGSSSIGVAGGMGGHASRVPVTRLAFSRRQVAGSGESFRLRPAAFLPHRSAMSVFRIDGLDDDGVWKHVEKHARRPGRRMHGRGDFRLADMTRQVLELDLDESEHDAATYDWIQDLRHLRQITSRPNDREGRDRGTRVDFRETPGACMQSGSSGDHVVHDGYPSGAVESKSRDWGRDDSPVVIRFDRPFAGGCPRRLPYLGLPPKPVPPGSKSRTGQGLGQISRR